MGTIPDLAQLGVSFALGGVSTAMHGVESRSLMDYQNDLYRQNLADERAYTDPSAVMARYRRAGLNPDLLLGQGVSMSSGSAPMGALGSSGSPDFDGHLAAVSAASLTQAQADNVKADTELKEIEAKDKAEDVSRKQWQNESDREWYALDKFYQSAGQYYDSLKKAVDVWMRGYDPSHHKNGGDDAPERFTKEYSVMKTHLDSALNDVRNRYSLTDYDVKYLNQCFQSMVSRDKEQFDHDIDELRKHSSVLKSLSDNEFLQFVDYFLSKFSTALQQGSSAYRNFRKP